MSPKADPRSCLAYSMPEAAHYLRLPQSTLRSWVSGRAYETKGGAQRSKPLIVLPETGGLSFMSLMEGYAISTFRRVHGVPMQRVRKALANDFDVTIAQVEEAIRWEKPEIAA